MRKHLAVTFTLIAAGGLAVLYSGCAGSQNTNTNANSVAVATPAPTPDKAAIEAEVTRLENDWPRILKERDAAAVRRLEADDIVLVYFNGMLGSKEQDVKDVEAGSLTFDAWEISDLSVKVLNADAAVASLLVTVKNGKFKVDGNRSQDINGRFRALDTFARRNGQWQVVASAVVKLTPEAEQALAASSKPTPTASVSPATTAPSPRVSPTVRPSPARPSPARQGTPAPRPSPAERPSPRAIPTP